MKVPDWRYGHSRDQLSGHVKEEHANKIETLALYWHFVDAIWIVVFTVVYIIGR